MKNFSYKQTRRGERTGGEGGREGREVNGGDATRKGAETGEDDYRVSNVLI